MNRPLRIKNGQAIHRAAIPDLGLEGFRKTVLKITNGDGFVVQFFAYQEGPSDLRLLSVLRQRSDLWVCGCSLPESYPSLTQECPKFHMFEREIAEQFAVLPQGHPWLKMVRYHANYRAKLDIFGNDYTETIPGNFPFFQITGDGVHEVAVGPVHAGIIEPGHFRFQCAGEEVLNLEIQLGYQHRGTERLLERSELPQNRLPLIAEAIAGDTAIGHGLCHAQAIEALAGLVVNTETQKIRTVALELERIANHLGDLGALSGDVAFTPPLAYLGRIRGEFLNLLLGLSGNRFGKGLIRPGGISFAVGHRERGAILDTIRAETPSIINVCDLLFSAHTVLARFERTGTVSQEVAAQLGLVGYAGRASGLSYDARFSHPTECFGELEDHENRCTVGDVYSRAMIRREEIDHSLGAIVQLLEKGNDAAALQIQAPHKLAPDSFVVTINEAWRGEVSHCILTTKEGSILRYKVKDPSFHNWTGLAMALRNQAISDFPLCNKSFNLSYCGFDL